MCRVPGSAPGRPPREVLQCHAAWFSWRSPCWRRRSPLSPARADASELESEGAGPCDDPPRPLPRRRQWTSETGVGLSLGFPTGLKIREALTAPSGLLLGGDADLHTVLIYSGASAGLMAGWSFDVPGVRAMRCDVGPTSVVRVWGIAGLGGGSIMGIFGGFHAMAYGRAGLGLEWRNRGLTGLGFEVGLAFHPQWDVRTYAGVDLPALPYAQLTFMGYTHRTDQR